MRFLFLLCLLCLGCEQGPPPTKQQIENELAATRKAYEHYTFILDYHIEYPSCCVDKMELESNRRRLSEKIEKLKKELEK